MASPLVILPTSNPSIDTFGAILSPDRNRTAEPNIRIITIKINSTAIVLKLMFNLQHPLLTVSALYIFYFSSKNYSLFDFHFYSIPIFNLTIQKSIFIIYKNVKRIFRNP
ncbi:hypothetical protein SDC9_159066 [bioreactor metagenome]|uniref:Uncharacterized protein n=1 Tax=bioreactor metagenome TaxID=1076179 RepID=A0A645FBL8_9ZZZZ